MLIGKFATGGLLLNNATTVKHLTESPDFRDAIGGDMEAWGLYQATGVAANKMQVAFQWIVVKGICDWGFGKSSAFQPLAAAAAADLVHAVFSAPNALPALQVHTIFLIFFGFLFVLGVLCLCFVSMLHSYLNCSKSSQCSFNLFQRAEDEYLNIRHGFIMLNEALFMCIKMQRTHSLYLFD